MSRSSRLVLRILSYFVLALPGTGTAQSPIDTARAIANIDRDVAAIEIALQREVWPGYYYTKLGVMYVIPGRAKIAAHWPGQGPAGMQALDGFADVVWTDTGVVRWQPGLPVASLAVSRTQSRASVAGVAMHEAFHAFEVTQRRDGRRFGHGENAMVTARYPLFDIENEAQYAVESRLLRSAVLARTPSEARAFARQFLAVRRQRQARLDNEFVNYEKAAEQHEGLAQYTLLRGLAVLAQNNPKYVAGAAEERKFEGDYLANTLAATNLSPRRRAYAAGSYIGLLLDRLAGSTWKQRVMDKDEWLQDILTTVVGERPVSPATALAIKDAMRDAGRSVAGLQARRAAQRDSILSSAPMNLIVDPIASPRHFEWCGFDPQNLLATGSGQLMHTRMLNLCSSGNRIAGIFRPAVEDQHSGRVQVSVDPALLTLTMNGIATQLPEVGGTITGEKLVLRTSDVEIELKRGFLLRGQSALLVVPLPD